MQKGPQTERIAILETTIGQLDVVLLCNFQVLHLKEKNQQHKVCLFPYASNRILPFLDVYTEDIKHGNTAWYYARWFTLRKRCNYVFSFLYDFASGHFTASKWTDLQAEQAGEAEKRTYINNAGNAPINVCHCQSLAQCNHQTSDGMSDSPVPCSMQPEAFLWKAVRQSRCIWRELKANWQQPGNTEAAAGTAVADVLLFESVLSSCLSHAEAANASCTCRNTDRFALAGLFVMGSLSWGIALVFWGLLWLSW